MIGTYEACPLFVPDSHDLRYLPEGPTAIGNGRFSWVAIQHGPDSLVGSLNIFDLNSRQNTRYNLPGRPGFAKPTSRDGVFIVGCERQLGLFHTQDSLWEVLIDGIDNDVSNTIINDGTCYEDNVIFGTKDLEFRTRKAGLYLYRGRDQQLFRLRADQICSNGKQVVSDGNALWLFDIDSPTRKVVRYHLNLDLGRLENEETVIDLSDLEGVPDGMVLTPNEKSVIISLYNPNPAKFGETRQYRLDGGQLEAIWRTPGSPQATCPALIEHPAGRVELVITTAVENMPQERWRDSPLAGALFIAETNLLAPVQRSRYNG
jgi:sugar lactone lactonase YvrE